MRRVVLLLAAVTATMLLASGVALALNTVRCGDLRCRGTANADELIGTESHDDMFGLGGKDKLVGRGGEDQLQGNGGDDILRGGTGLTSSCGGPGDDILDVGPNSPRGGDSFHFSPGWGKDTISGSVPDSDPEVTYLSFQGCWPVKVHSEVTRDLTIKLKPVRGPQVTDGINTIEWGRGYYFIRISDGWGDDKIIGDGRANLIESESGEDTVRSGAGADDIYVHDDGDSDHVDCGEGTDFVLFDKDLDTVSRNCERKSASR